MDAFFSSVNSAETSAYQWFCLISVLLSLAMTALVSVSRWHIFKKLGLPGWKGIIPIYGDYTLFKNRWKVKPFWALMISSVVYYGGMILTGFVMSNNLSAVTAFGTVEEIKSFFIPYTVICGLSALAYAIISLVITMALNYRLAESFGDGIGTALGLTILPAVFYPILAFAKKQETRRKKPLQMVSAVLTLALVFSIVTCAPFTVSAAETDSADTGANYEELAGTAAGTDAPFGELSEGKYSLTSTTYQLTEDVVPEGCLYIPSDVTAVIDLNGHTLDRGLSDSQSYADFIVNDGTLTITDSSGDNSGMLTGGYADCGGAVVNNGTLTVEGGTFYNNRSYHYAGAVVNNAGATLNVTGGVFKGNSDGDIQGAGGGGGAIVNYGTMNMSGGIITGNTAHPNGGGIWNGNGGVLNLTGGTISGNYATGSGSGIYARADGMVNVSGSPVVKDNAGSSLWLNGSSVINVTDTLTSAAKIDVSGDSLSTRAVTSGLSGNGTASNFSFANGATAARLENNGTEIIPNTAALTYVSTWNELKNAVKTNNNTIALSTDITNGDQEANFEIDGKTITIDLRGHYINMNRLSKDMSDNGHFMYVLGGSNVTIKDSFGGGYITGGNGTNGGVFHVSSNANSLLNLYNVTLKNNIGENGGALYSESNLNLYGCVIADNTANTDGGAVYVNDDKNFSATGTVFIGNSASGEGSGGAICSHGTFTLTSCIVSDNTAPTWGGGLYSANNATEATITDTLLKNNSATSSGSGRGGAVYVHKDPNKFDMIGCMLIGNSAKYSGGAVHVNGESSDNKFYARSTIFTGNKTTNTTVNSVGGAIYAISVIRLNSCTVTGNSAKEGGGVWTSKRLDVLGLLDITGNSSSNVYLAGEDSCFGRVGAISDGTQIDYRAEIYDRFIVSNLKSAAEGNCFILDEAGTDSYELVDSCYKLPMSSSLYGVYVKKTMKYTVNSWQGLQDAINDGDYAKIITLSGNITASSDQTRIRIYNGDDITLDLNGKTLSRARDSKDKNGNVIEVHGGGKLTIRDSSSGKTGKITGGWANHGGGINVNENGYLKLESGTISGNKAEDGGGVYVHDDGEFYMSGGAVDSNKADQDGGGIFADYPVTVTGGTISNNKAKYGGGYYFDEPGMTAELSGATITGNTASEKGGGIYIWHGTVTATENLTVSKNKAYNGGGVCVTDKCTFTADNTTFHKNTATNNGGGIYNDENLTVSSCTFTENEATKNGGGVYNSDTAVITGCTFKKNKTINGTGGAINQYNGSLLIDGGEITENAAAYRGSGVYVHEESDNEKFKIKGDVRIVNNTATDLFLDEDEVVVIADTLSSNARVRVSLERISGTFTKGFHDNHVGDNPAAYFTADDGFAIIADSNGEAMIIESDWTLLKNEIEGAADNATVTLSRNWKAISKDKTITIPSGKHLTLDLNGYTIDGDMALTTSIFDVKGTLTITDTSKDHNGEITGGNSETGGAVYINAGATVNLNNGSIADNAASTDGGGIYNNGTLNVSGGSVTGNSAKYGAGIYNTGSAVTTFTGGTIINNMASENGGGVWNSATLNLKGGKISDNSAVKLGGGIYVRQNNTAVLNVEQGPEVEKNSAAIGKNIFLQTGRVITLTGDLNPTAKLDVVVKSTTSPITSGYASYGSPASAFTYNGKTGKLYEDSGELYLRAVTGGTAINSWDELQTAINNSASGQVLVLKTNLDGTNKNRLDVDGKTVTVELNGYTIDRKRTSSSDSGQVFYVHNGANLTISDAAGTGVITGGNVSGDGGGILIDSGATCTITGGSVQGNKASSDGGGISVKGTLEMTGGSVAFNTAGDTAGGIYCTDSGTIKLDDALITGNKANDDDGGGLNIHLADDDSYIKNSVISNNYSDNNGGGFRLDAKGKKLTLEDTEIKGNTAADDGGGFYISEGTVDITRGSVNYNTADNGGAVYFEGGTKLEATGTHFDHNTATKHGAGAINCRSDMTLTDCFVDYNECKQDGGGIYFDCLGKKIKITRTEIDNNYAGGVGGGIGVEDAEITFTRGSISHNKAEKNGGGVHLDGRGNQFVTFKTAIDYNFTPHKSGGGIYLQTGEAHIQGGSISDNFSKYNGGGIYIEDNTRLYIEEAEEEVEGTQTKEAAVFYHNNCDQRGGAIYLEDDGTLHINSITVTDTLNRNDALYADEDFYIQGKIVFSNNNGSDIFMEDDDDKIHLEDRLHSDSVIGVSLDYKTGSFTDGYRTNHAGEDPTKYFHAEDGYAIALDDKGEVRVRSTDWITIQNQIDAATNGSTVQLTKNYTADEADNPLEVASGKEIILDLNGFALDGDKAIGAILYNKGTLTVTDSANSQLAMITGGTSAAIINSGTLTISGGKLTGNTGSNGGAVTNTGTMTIDGGEISGNTATNGGAIYNIGRLYLYGGEIKNNSAVSGGGIFCAPSYSVYAHGAPYVKDNSAASGKNILLSKGAVVIIDGELSTSAKLDVATKAFADALTNGYRDNGSVQGVFTYNESNTITLIQKQSDGELYFPYDLSEVNKWVSSWAELQGAVNDAQWQGKIIGLEKDLGVSGQRRIVVDNKNVTIELAGHTMDRARTSKEDEGNVFWVTGNNATLTIKDTVETGVITGGYAKGDGGGFYVKDGATLTIAGGSIQGNKASVDGGGISIHGATLNMTAGSVSGNYAGDNGGGIYTTKNAVMTLTNVSITFNTSHNAGGGMNIHLKENATVTNCVISNNTSETEDGGGFVLNAGKTLSLVNSVVSNNTAEDEGGGIYIDDGTVEMSGGSINGNTAKDGGGVYVSGGDKFKATNGAVITLNQTTKQSGGGITCKGDLELNGATVSYNHSAKHGGGIYYQHGGHEITLTSTSVANNKADKDGGGIYLEAGTITLDGGTLSGNTSVDGGGIFVTGNTDFTAKNSAEITGNIVTEQDGGGIVNKGKTTLEDVTVTNNEAKLGGGGIWNDGTLNISGTTISNNKAKREHGGGICHKDGKLYFTGENTVTANTTGCFGAGIFVDEEADEIYIQDKLNITNNNGSNVYLDEEVLTLSGPLDPDARISVCLESDYGKFTKNFRDYHTQKPKVYFASDYFYEVGYEDREAVLKWVEEDDNPFIPKNEQVRDADKVTGRNWMSAVSGERRINEINLIRSHDASMNDVKANIGSSLIRSIGFSAALGILAFGAIIGAATGGAGLVFAAAGVGGLLAGIMIAFQEFSAYCAKTQYRYIDEQMNMGVRIFDLRINNYNYDKIANVEDNENLWHCHGESTEAGAFYGRDHDGDIMNTDTTLGWAKEFLKNNPTEVILFEYDPETQDDSKYQELIFKRLKTILKKLSYEVNPSTGKPYLYLEDGQFKNYTYWPKLKDVRGQILFRTSGDLDIVGGYKWEMNGTSPNYCRAIGSNDTINTAEERINQTNSAFETHPSPYILKDAMVHRNINSGLYVNTTDDPGAMFKWIKFKDSWVTKSPTELAEQVFYGTGDTEGLLEEGGHFNQTGLYYGIISADGLTEKECQMFYKSNFYDGLEYRKITVRSGLAGDETVKEYKVLKGTAITIPNCIYDKPEGSTSYFQCWNATTGSSGSWEPNYSLQSAEYLGSDNVHGSNYDWLMEHSYLEAIDADTQIPQNSTREVMPGDTVTIMDDTEFVAVWGSDIKTPVTVVWNDGDDADGLRADRLEITYNNSDLSDTNTAYVDQDEQWSTIISGDTVLSSIKVVWDQVKVTNNAATGSELDGYKYTVTGEVGKGFTVTLTHKPTKTVTTAGIVTWDDNNNVRNVRPDSVTLKLYKNGEELAAATATSSGGWRYTLGNGSYPEYSEVVNDGVTTYQRDVYSVVEEPFTYYSATYDDFNITNVYVDPEIPDVNVEINWKDGSNSYGERPKNITLHLWDGNTEIDKKVVEVDPDAAVTLCYFEVKEYELANPGKNIEYSITQDPIPNYSVKSNEPDGRMFSFDNEYDYVGKYFQGHSLSLNGDIGVNFYLKLTPEELSTAKIHFEWFNKTLDLNGSDFVYNSEQQMYKASCPVAVAEMTYDVNATLTIGGEEVEKDKYSVVKYANVILTDKSFRDKYINCLKEKYGDDYNADVKYYQLLELVMKMLDYGAKAQLVFDRDTDNLANGGIDLFRDEITADDIKSEPGNMAKGLEDYGLEYQYSSVVFLSGTTLRHFYKITDQTKYNEIKSSIKFRDEENNVDYAVAPAKRGDLICFQKKDIAASQLDNQYVLMIGDSSYKYSVMDGIKLMMDSKPDNKSMELCKATYRYNQAANEFFGH